jgi:hypothetical protein
MHDRESGVVLKWEDLRIKGDVVFGKPVINLSHPRAQQTIDEVENGFLNAASVGHIVVLEWTDEATFKLPNQEGPTVTKWFNRECSLVDIPGNFNSYSLFDKADNPISLAALKATSKPLFSNASISSKTTLFPEAITRYKLSHPNHYEKLCAEYAQKLQKFYMCSWVELSQFGLLEDLKAYDFALFNVKFKQEYGKDYCTDRTSGNTSYSSFRNSK